MLSARERVVGLIAVSTAVALCLLLVDRPLALWLNARFYGTTAFAIGVFILRPLDGLLVAGLVFLLVAIVWRRLGGAPTWVHRFVVGGAGAAIALLGALVLKVAIGRSQVYPPFLQDHVYLFRPFAGSLDFRAFPSATMAAIGALVVGVGVQRRSQRAVAAVVLITLAAALLVTASHWLSDIIGGTYLGVVTGAAVARRLGQREGLRPDRRLQPATADAIMSSPRLNRDGRPDSATDWIDAVFRKWTADSVPLNPPATAADVARLEAALGAALPSDVAYYFSVADGMPDGAAADESLTNFWSIDRMLSDPWSPSGSDERGAFRDLAFADVMISSWFICFRVRPASGVSIHVEGPPLELPSLEEFFRRYLADPRTLYL